MKSIRTEITIDATPEDVWKTLMDFKRYPTWNTFVTSISGTPKQGKTLNVIITLSEKRKFDMTPKVLVCDAVKEFRWRGKTGINGIFDGEHYFQLEALGDGKTKVTQGEDFSGILTGIIFKMVKKDTVSGFERMNEELKVAAQALSI